MSNRPEVIFVQIKPNHSTGTAKVTELWFQEPEINEKDLNPDFSEYTAISCLNIYVMDYEALPDFRKNRTVLMVDVREAGCNLAEWMDFQGRFSTSYKGDGDEFGLFDLGYDRDVQYEDETITWNDEIEYMDF